MPINKKDFLTQIRALRKETGLTQEQFAQKAGVSFKTYCNIERGTFISAQSLQKIGEALGITIKKYHVEVFEFHKPIKK